jgi:hypothetical protein
MPMPPEFWNDKRLEQAACDELIRHGGNKADLKQLKAEFRKARENNNPDGIIHDNESGQTGNIPT